MIHVCKGGNPSYTDGKLNVGGAEEFDRAESFRAEIGFIREMTGTQLSALRITIVRDVEQGAPSDILAYKTMYGVNGRAQQTVFPLRVLFIDDVGREQPVHVGTIICEEAIVAGIRRSGGKQVITFLGSRYKYHNVHSGKDEPQEANLVPIVVPDFVHQQQ